MTVQGPLRKPRKDEMSHSDGGGGVRGSCSEPTAVRLSLPGTVHRFPLRCRHACSSLHVMITESDRQLTKINAHRQVCRLPDHVGPTTSTHACTSEGAVVGLRQTALKYTHILIWGQPCRLDTTRQSNRKIPKPWGS